MNDASIQIRNPDAVRAIRQLASESGKPITQAVGDAVAAELQRRRCEHDEEWRRRLAAIHDIARRFRELPTIGPGLADEDLYDEDGLPR
jgi:hypothetical protein